MTVPFPFKMQGPDGALENHYFITNDASTQFFPIIEAWWIEYHYIRSALAIFSPHLIINPQNN